MADPTLAEAILDRVLASSHHIAMKGPSLRRANPATPTTRSRMRNASPQPDHSELICALLREDNTSPPSIGLFVPTGPSAALGASADPPAAKPLGVADTPGSTKPHHLNVQADVPAASASKTHPTGDRQPLLSHQEVTAATHDRPHN